MSVQEEEIIPRGRRQVARFSRSILFWRAFDPVSVGAIAWYKFHLDINFDWVFWFDTGEQKERKVFESNKHHICLQNQLQFLENFQTDDTVLSKRFSLA